MDLIRNVVNAKYFINGGELIYKIIIIPKKIKKEKIAVVDVMLRTEIKVKRNSIKIAIPNFIKLEYFIRLFSILSLLEFNIIL